MADTFSQNDLYELVADFGEVLGIGLRRDSHFACAIEDPKNWLNLKDEIGSARVHELSSHLVEPSADELDRLIRWQVKTALDQLNAEITPTIWLCQADGGQVLAIEGWGDSIEVELLFRIIGKYPSRSDALGELSLLYIFDANDL